MTPNVRLILVALWHATPAEALDVLPMLADALEDDRDARAHMVRFQLEARKTLESLSRKYSKRKPLPIVVSYRTRVLGAFPEFTTPVLVLGFDRRIDTLFRLATISQELVESSAVSLESYLDKVHEKMYNHFALPSHLLAGEPSTSLSNAVAANAAFIHHYHLG